MTAAPNLQISQAHHSPTVHCHKNTTHHLTREIDLIKRAVQPIMLEIDAVLQISDEIFETTRLMKNHTAMFELLRLQPPRIIKDPARHVRFQAVMLQFRLAFQNAQNETAAGARIGAEALAMVEAEGAEAGELRNWLITKAIEMGKSCKTMNDLATSLGSLMDNAERIVHKSMKVHGLNP